MTEDAPPPPPTDPPAAPDGPVFNLPPTPPVASAAQRALELEAARSQKSPVLTGLLVVGALLAGVGIGFALSSATAKPVVAPEPAPSASSAPVEEKPEPTFLELVASGDYKALEKLSEKPVTERSVAEAVAATRGRRVTKRLAFEGFAKKMKADGESALEDREQFNRLWDYFVDRQTADYAAELMAELPGTKVADLLYQLWTKPKTKSETTELAQDLLRSPDFADKMSPALRVALDLRFADTCEQFKEILPRADEHGDTRSLRAVLRLNNKYGCGENKREDCYECLRPPKGDKKALTVTDVVRSVRKRRAPKFKK